MRIEGYYLKTLQRDRADGTAVFYMIPNCKLKQLDSGSRLRCTGKIKSYNSGEPVIMEGEFDGDVFVVTHDRIDSRTRRGIDHLLMHVNGYYLNHKLTVSQMERILDICNDDIFAFCADDSCIPILINICKRSKDGEDTAKKLVKIIRNLSHREAFFDLLMGYGVAFDRIDKMLQKNVTMDDLRESPYIIFSRFDVPIGIADAFARQECNMEDYAYARCLGFVYAAMRYLNSCGNSCCTMDQLVSTINSRYQKSLNGAYFGPALINVSIMNLEGLCSYQTIDGTTYIYLNVVWGEESEIAHHIRRLQNSRKQYKTTVTVDDTAAEIGINYNEGQRQAFRLLETSGVKVLTGPPGSGKTAVVNGLIRNFESNKNGTVHLAASTGMAARVMHDATDRYTETAHAMLRVVPYDNCVRGRDLNDPVDADLIIVDEISMIGVQLFSILVGAARGGSTVLLVGDEDQLLSVDYGNVLHDLIASGEVEVCRLTEILRQSGTICTNAARVNRGDTHLEQNATFTIRSANANNIQHLLMGDYDPRRSQVISPMKRGPMGTAALNCMIQSYINGQSPVVATYGRRHFRVGDKIIMTKNNYEAGYINGDIGYIKSKSKTGQLIVEFVNGILQLDDDDLCNMDLAYAITIHKSQGSEFGRVHIVLPEQATCMMSRRLLYTAITRAKKQVFIYNQGNSLANAIADRGEKPRVTMLQQRLRAMKQARW